MDGNLSITISSMPSVNDSFDLFDFSSQTGAFDSIDFGSQGFDGTFDYATGALTITAVPEPEMFGFLAGLFGLGLAAQRRKK